MIIFEQQYDKIYIWICHEIIYNKNDDNDNNETNSNNN